MADFYTQFAFYLENEIYGEAVLKDIQEIMEKIDDCQKQGSEPDFPEWFKVDDHDAKKFSDYGHGCKFEMDQWRGYLSISHDESGDPEMVADIIRQALKHNNSEACVGFEFANTCSTPKHGEFAGGAFFITKDEVEHTRNYLWLSRKMDEHRSEQANPAP
jgi:hypothetical protein